MINQSNPLSYFFIFTRRSSLRRGKLLALAFIVASLCSSVTSQCGNTEGCFPPEINLHENMDQWPARSVSASNTCEDGEEYRSLIITDLNRYTCQSGSRRVTNVLDDDEGFTVPTYWQSRNMLSEVGGTPIEQSITFSFTDKFLMHEIWIRFTSPEVTGESNMPDARPSAMTVDLWDSGQQAWVASQYYARDCASSFPGVPLLDPYDTDRDYTVAYCHQYTDYATDYDNWVEYYPGSFYDKMQQSRSLTDQYSTASVRLNFRSPAGSTPTPLTSYVAVRTVTIVGQCLCYGHADTCTGPNGATCDCQHATTGPTCESCLPLYNNQQWTIGTQLTPGTCAACNCNNHASSCTFDPAKNYGVCDTCTDNTAGDTCDTCLTGYYVNPDTTTSGSADFCLACACNQAGTDPNELNTCDVTSGQCTCKSNTNSRDCGQCADTYWGLDGALDTGCKECDCDAGGSQGSRNMCDKLSGTCLCKDNVQGTRCDQCKINTYGFAPTNPLGCSACDCDLGAAVTGDCNLANGQCTCRSSELGGRDCRSPIPGYFVARMDVMVLEPEAFTEEGIILRPDHGTAGARVSGRGLVRLTSANQLSIAFTSTFTGTVDIVARYEQLSTDSAIFIQGQLTLGGTSLYVCESETINPGRAWPLSFSGVSERTRDGVKLGQSCVRQGYDYTLQLSSTAAVIAIDSVVLLPDFSAQGVELGRVDPAEVTRCAEEARREVRADRQSCSDTEYSVMAAYLGQAIACSCSTGSLRSIQCEPKSGDCDCRAGVLPPACDVCEVDQYQFSVDTGCIPCGCSANGSVHAYCDNQGQCECLPNVQPPKCDVCLTEFYGHYTGAGCQACQCDMNYSVNNVCDDQGLCTCKAGVGGDLCQACLGGFYNLTQDGCTACACNQYGSTSEGCDVISGICECLGAVEGSTCSKCKPGNFGLGRWHSNGCVPCFCWGHAQTCSSQGGWFESSISSEWLVSDPNALAEKWTAKDADSTDIPVTTPFFGQTQRYAMRVSPEATPYPKDVFLKAPPKYFGDRRSAYGRVLTLTVSPTSPSAVPGSTIEGQVVLAGMYSDVRLVYTFNVNTAVASLVHQVPMNELYWRVLDPPPSDPATSNDTNSNGEARPQATYRQMVEILAHLVALEIRAYTANAPELSLDLLGVELASAVTGSGRAVINNLELCQCQEGYMGTSCERCAPGYSRAVPGSSDPGSQCVPCSCNGHSLTTCDSNTGVCAVTPCDPVTGVCVCGFSTQGDHCDQCVKGYYGNALVGNTDDCLPCACPGIIVNNEVNVFATDCVQNQAGNPVCVDCQTGYTGDQCQNCVDGYYGTPENATNNGGVCTLCVCNGRADTCDTRTGQCVDCRENTAGQNCQICAARYFGDAMTSTCQPCTCDVQPGSTGECNPSSGACECLPNVTGDRCDVCMDTTFNLTEGQGCEPCNCFDDGSVSLICNKESGQCPCAHALIEGRQCDRCTPNFWNINKISGCNPCNCNPTGTVLVDGVASQTCDVITGQCQCSIPAIVGRTCDQCSPVTTYSFTYVSAFFLGTYPQCELCGECYDSWGLIVDDIGQRLDGLNKKTLAIWDKYDRKSAAEIDSSLTETETQLNSSLVSLTAFEAVGERLGELTEDFDQTLTRQAASAALVNSLSLREQTLSTALNAIAALTQVVTMTDNVQSSLAQLRQQLTGLVSQAQSFQEDGDSSWTEIQTLAFVVAPPAERERQLTQQANRAMETARLAEETFALAENIYNNILTPGVTDRQTDLDSASTSNSETKVKLTEVTSILDSVEALISSLQATLVNLVTSSEQARVNMQSAIAQLQTSVINVSVVRTLSNRITQEAVDFQTVARRAEQTMVDSMTSLLESLASLSQAESQLKNAEDRSEDVLKATIRPVSDMTSLVQQIADAAVTAEDVEELNLNAQRALFTAEQALGETQQALNQARQVKDELDTAKSDVDTSRDLRIQADGLRLAANSQLNDIQDTLAQAKEYSDAVDAEVASVDAEAKAVQGAITQLTNCFSQRQLQVNNAQTSATQVDDREKSASQSQLDLLQLMLTINQEGNEGSVTEALTSLTSASSVLDGLDEDRATLLALEDMDAFVQQLQSQEAELNDLELEVNQLTSDLDNILLSLEESAGGTTCNLT